MEECIQRREFVHVDAVKEFYARMTLTHLKKKDVVKTSVRGVAIEFDHLKSASILGIPGNNGICEYIKEVWEESRTSDRGSSCSNISSFTRRFHKSAEGADTSRVDPSGPSGHIPDPVMSKLQAEFERARANRFQADLEKA
ncbi:hypothetical protein Dimus_029925 [Dionaea muscipula]